jgi:hypothetical protein
MNKTILMKCPISFYGEGMNVKNMFIEMQKTLSRDISNFKPHFAHFAMKCPCFSL